MKKLYGIYAKIPSDIIKLADREIIDATVTVDQLQLIIDCKYGSETIELSPKGERVMKWFKQNQAYVEWRLSNYDSGDSDSGILLRAYSDEETALLSDLTWN